MLFYFYQIRNFPCKKIPIPKVFVENIQPNCLTWELLKAAISIRLNKNLAKNLKEDLWNKMSIGVFGKAVIYF